MKNQKTTIEMPYNLQAEEQAIAILLKFPKERQEYLNEISFSDMFYSIDCKTAFNAINSLIAQNKPITDVNLNGEMININSTSKYNFIEKISKINISSMKFGIIVENLKKAKQARKIIEIAQNMTNCAQNGNFDLNELMLLKNELEYTVENDVNEENKTKSFGDVTVETTNELLDTNNFLKSGFYVFDKENLFSRTAVVILAARPSMGKTALALCLFNGLAKNGSAGIFFSVETKNTKLMPRIMSNICNIPFESFKDIEYLKTNMPNIISILANETNEYNSNMEFQDSGYLTVEGIRKHIKTSNRIRKLKNQKPLSFIIVDYLQLLSSDSKKSASVREQEIAVISRGLKILAKDFDLCVIELAQVSRNVDNRAKKRPELSDLRESGSIEQDADNVAFIVRQEYYGVAENEDGNPTKGIAEIKVAKNRDGKTGLFEMKCDLVYQRFDNLGTVYLQDNISSQSTTVDWSV